MTNTEKHFSGPFHNFILDTLPMSDRKALAPHLIPVNLALGQNLYWNSDPIHQLYFPTTGIVSIVHALTTGASAEIMIIGNEGVVGLGALLSDGVMRYQTVVRASGTALRLNGGLFKASFQRSNAVRKLVLDYLQAEFGQVAQTAVCNRYHTIDRQLCRWILRSLNRLPSNRLLMTQEQVANLIGVSREEVSRAACRLQQQGLIHYRRGEITVIDRRLLERACCECYAVTKAALDRLVTRVK